MGNDFLIGGTWSVGGVGWDVGDVCGGVEGECGGADFVSSLTNQRSAP